MSIAQLVRVQRRTSQSNQSADARSAPAAQECPDTSATASADGKRKSISMTLPEGASR